MTDEIKINYDAVYAKTKELQSRMESELREMETGYRKAHSSLNGMDSQTNATLTECMTANQAKARAIAETVQHLRTFIENATRAAEQEDKQIARVFSSTRINIRPQGGKN